VAFSPSLHKLKPQLTLIHTQGHVYIEFADSMAAQRAIALFNGRFFAGKQIVAEFVPEANCPTTTSS
jgi:hypothetical protein